MSAYPDWVSLREIDGRAGAVKGTAFRAFKRLAPTLVDGRDYRLLDAEGHGADIAVLKAAGRIYDSSVNVLLLSPAIAERVLAAMQGSPPRDGR